VSTLGGPAIVANAEIAAGEIIGLERPIASYLEKEFVKTNCWNCLVTLKEGSKSTSNRERERERSKSTLKEGYFYYYLCFK
jgi:hypothetical protein